MTALQQAEIFELFKPILKQNTRQRRMTDYAVGLVLLLLLGWGAYSSWRSGQVPQIESLALVPGSVRVIGPAERVAVGGGIEFCPGDTMTAQYELVIDGEGTIYADDAAHHNNNTVKFSDLWRDIVTPGTRTYQDAWLIPAQPDMAIDGQRRWVGGYYVRVFSIAASNVYVSRYVPPATFEVPFKIAEGCN